MSDRLAEARSALDTARSSRAELAPDLFSEPLELAAAIDSATSYASDEWRDAAIEAVRCAALDLDVLDVERVQWPEGDGLLDARARGGIMRDAAKAGFIASLRTYVPSSRPESHRRPLLQWRSRLREGDQ